MTDHGHDPARDGDRLTFAAEPPRSPTAYCRECGVSVDLHGSDDERREAIASALGWFRRRDGWRCGSCFHSGR